jgi:hypothetical protein
MHDPGSLDSSYAGKIAAVIEQSVHKRATAIARCRVNDKAARLVYDNHARVLVHYVQRDFLWRDGSRFERRHMNLDEVSGTDLVRRLRGPARVS